MDYDALIRAELGPMRALRARAARERGARALAAATTSASSPATRTPTARSRLRSSGMRAVLARLNRYPDGSARALKRALGEHLGVADENVVVGNGSNELLRLIAQAVLRPGDEVVFAWPSFVVYPMVCAAVRRDGGAACRSTTARCTTSTRCSPRSPTARSCSSCATRTTRPAPSTRATRSRRSWTRCPTHVLVVVDEAYFEFVDRRATTPTACAYFDGERPLVRPAHVQQDLLAGRRCASATASCPQPLVAAVDKIREPFNVNTVAQVGAYYSLDDEAEVRRRRDENQEQKTYLYSCFDRLGVSLRAVGDELRLRARRRSRSKCSRRCSPEGVIVRDFGTAPALRVGVGTPEDTRATDRGLRGGRRRSSGPL